MDKITKSLLEEFVKSEGFEQIEEDKQFERFATYCVLTQQYSESFGIDEVMTGGGNDLGIDSITTIVNGSLVDESEDVDDLVATNGYLDVTFLFVQAKRTSGFDGAEMSSFAFGVKDFFADAPQFPRNEYVEHIGKLQSHIFSKGAAMRRRKPIVKMYYVTTGKWAGDVALEGRRKNASEDLMATGLFEEVQYVPVDGDQLQKLYRATKSKVAAEITIRDKVTLPDMAGVEEAYLGYLPATEYLSLITDPSGGIRKSLFYDNVRDFQDYNEINKEIRDTVMSGQKEHFVLMNNGITIITKGLRTVANKFHLEDFQIVNGCQTSHVLYDNRGALTEKLNVPIKIIHTTDEPLTNAIIKATNRQTEVKPDQLYALSDFQKKLELYYETFDDPKRLHYERRSNQYGDGDVSKSRIIPIQTQVRTFASMFLDEPHKGHYARSLRPYIGDKIFNKKHQLEPYFVAAYAHFRLEYLFRLHLLDSKYKPARFHLLMIARHIWTTDPMPKLEANQMRRYCEKLLAILKEDRTLRPLFEEATDVLDRVLAGRAITRDLMKTQPFTDELRRHLAS